MVIDGSRSGSTTAGFTSSIVHRDIEPDVHFLHVYTE